MGLQVSGCQQLERRGTQRSATGCDGCLRPAARGTHFCVCIYRCVCTCIYTHWHGPLVDFHLGQAERRNRMRSLVPFTLVRVLSFMSALLCGASSVYLSCGHACVCVCMCLLGIHAQLPYRLDLGTQSCSRFISIVLLDLAASITIVNQISPPNVEIRYICIASGHMLT